MFVVVLFVHAVVFAWKFGVCGSGKGKDIGCPPCCKGKMECLGAQAMES